MSTNRKEIMWVIRITVLIIPAVILLCHSTSDCPTAFPPKAYLRDSLRAEVHRSPPKPTTIIRAPYSLQPDSTDRRDALFPQECDYQKPGILLSASPLTGCALLPVTFSLESVVRVTACIWDFGDGIRSNKQNPIHCYTDPGIYRVSLVVYYLNTVDTLQLPEPIVVSAHPTAAFSVSPMTGQRPLTVTFDNLSTDADGWFWDFGDGKTSATESAHHTYLLPGTYTVTLTAFNPCGEHTIQKTKVIHVLDCRLPHADFVISSGQGTAPHEVSFTCQAHNASSWSWDFGDGATSTDEHPVHTYRKVGTYTVTLAVSNDCGSAQLINTNGIVVTKKQQLSICIRSMDAVIQHCWLLQRPMVRVQVADILGTPVSDATVHGYWVDSPDHSCISVTDHLGWATYHGDWHTDVTPRTFRISGIEKSGCLYNREIDVMRSIDVSRMTAIVETKQYDAADILATFDQPAMINYPNPFNAVTKILYFLPEEGPVSIKMYNSVGQHISTLMDSFQSAGIHALEWNGQDTDRRPVASGMYFCILQSQKAQLSHKIVLIK